MRLVTAFLSSVLLTAATALAYVESHPNIIGNYASIVRQVALVQTVGGYNFKLTVWVYQGISSGKVTTCVVETSNRDPVNCDDLGRFKMKASVRGYRILENRQIVANFDLEITRAPRLGYHFGGTGGTKYAMGPYLCDSNKVGYCEGHAELTVVPVVENDPPA